jgi:hypothetical protein
MELVSVTTKNTPELRINDKILYKKIQWDLLLDLEQNGYVIDESIVPLFLGAEIESVEARELLLKTLNTTIREIKPTKWFRINGLEKMITRKIDDEDVSFILYGDQDRTCYLFYLSSNGSLGDRTMYGTFLIDGTDIRYVIMGVSDERSFIDCTHFHFGGNNGDQPCRLGEQVNEVDRNTKYGINPRPCRQDQPCLLGEQVNEVDRKTKYGINPRPWRQDQLKVDLKEITAKNIKEGLKNNFMALLNQ